MRKTIIAIALAFITAIGAHAQSVFSSDNGGYFGIRLGLDVTCPTDWKINNQHMKIDYLKNGAGFSVGGIYHAPVMGDLYVEPGFKFYYHTVKNELETMDPDEWDGLKPVSGSIREFGFEIPVVFGYTFHLNPFSISVFTGPQLAVGLSGKQHLSVDINDTDFNGSDGIYDDYRRVDVAWLFGAGFDFGHWHVDLAGGPGMVDWAKGKNVSQRRNYFSLSLGYNF